MIYLLCRAAAQRWDGEGALLFTSSSGVYDVHDNGSCDEVSLFYAYPVFFNCAVLIRQWLITNRVQPMFMSCSSPDEGLC